MKHLIAFAIFFAVAPARAADIEIGLTDPVVQVNTSFSGAKVFLFGALSGDAQAIADLRWRSDIIAVVRGPRTTFSIRPMVRNGMVWTAGSPIYLHGAPSAFLVNSTRSLDEITSPALRETYHLDETPSALAPGVAPSNAQAAHFLRSRGADAMAEAFLANARRLGLYAEKAGAVSFKKGSLFTIAIDLPPKTPVGDYLVDVYLINDGKVVSHDDARLAVNKVGVERRIHELAHERPIAYGVMSVVFALAAGWLAAEIFRKRG